MPPHVTQCDHIVSHGALFSQMQVVPPREGLAVLGALMGHAEWCRRWLVAHVRGQLCHRL